MINLNDFMNEVPEEEEDVKVEVKAEITFQLKCDQCDFNSTELENLTKHMAATNHFPPSDPLAFKNPFSADQAPKSECESCKKKFKSKHGLAIHTAKSHVARPTNSFHRRQKVIHTSKSKNFQMQNCLPDSVKKESESMLDPLDALINRHMQMNQGILRIGREMNQGIVKIGRATIDQRLPARNARWDNTVPVPTGLFKST